MQGANLTFAVTAPPIPDGDDVAVSAMWCGPVDVHWTPSASVQLEPHDRQDVGTFSWTPGCDAVRDAAAYQLVFKATDNDAVPLSDVETVNVKVLARPVTGMQAAPIGNAVEVDWAEHPCTDSYTEAMQSLGGYEVHRRIGSYTVVSDHCEVGMPGGTGYEQIAFVQGLANNAFLDAVEPLSFGARLLLPGRGGHAQRCPKSKCGPDEACAVIDKGVPVMTGASVELPATESLGADRGALVSPDPTPTRSTPSPAHIGIPVLAARPAAGEPWVPLLEGAQPRHPALGGPGYNRVVARGHRQPRPRMWSVPGVRMLERYRHAIGTSATPAPSAAVVRLTPADNHVTLDGSCRAGRGATPPFVFHRVLLDGSLGTLLDTLRRFPNG